MPARSDSKILPVEDRFDIDVANSSGLNLRVRGGIMINPDGGGFKAVMNAALVLVASALNYVEVTDAGVIQVVQNGFTDGNTALWVVETGASTVLGIEDHRGSARATGVQELTTSGAIREDAEIVLLNRTTPLIAATIAAPRKFRRLLIVQADGGTAGHTVTLGAGTWNGTATIATFNAALDALDVVGWSATRFGIITNVGAVALT